MENAEELAEAGSEWIDMFHIWVAQGATGCVFAQRRARDPEAAQWLGVVLNSPPEGKDLDGLQSILQAASDAQAILLVFPSATTIEQVESIVEACHEHPAWFCEVIPKKDGVDHDEYVEVGIRWLLPNTRYRSEAIGFGPFEEFPVTRRAPVTALALRTHPPMVREPEGRVHLAQMPYDAREAAGPDWFWKRTGEQRTDYLAGKLEHAAKAKVTFRLPKSALTSSIRDLEAP